MPKIEILNIGTELLSGFTVNTNAAFLCRELNRVGFSVEKQTVVPDDPPRLQNGLREAMSRSSVVLTTGGLGPTVDDLSRKVVADLMGSDFRFDEQVAADLKKRFGESLTSLKDQATVPSKAKVILNQVGTAPGFIFEKDETVVIMLPGVPPEMKAMFQNDVMPYLKGKFPDVQEKQIEHLHFFGLPESAVDPTLRELQEKYPALEFGIYPGLGLLEVQIKMPQNGKQDQLDDCVKILREKFYKYVYSSPSGTIEGAVHFYFLQNGLTLSTAESCTGGSAAARLIKIPGASDYFQGSIVAYQNELKTSVLGVPENLIREHGAVSAEVVGRMAQGVQKMTGSDYALAVSGVAGPTGGSEEKPVGTVWCAIVHRDEDPYVWKIQARGTREMIITRSVNALFSQLLIQAGAHV